MVSSAREQHPDRHDVLDEIETLDSACGADDLWFRLKVRQMVERRRWQVLKRRQAENAESRL